MAKVLISDNQVSFIINKELAKTVNKNIPKFAKAVKPDIQDWVRIILKQHPIYTSLKGGDSVDLAAQFGFPAGTELEHIEPLIDVIADGVSVVSTRASVEGKKINIGVRIILYKDNFIDKLKKLPTSTIETTNQKGESYTLPWVEWLFERGTEIIIADYRIRFINSVSSRSGRAIMIPKGEWSVPSNYAGTSESNWVTRALNLNAGAVGIQNGLLAQQIERILYKHMGILV